MKNNDIRNLENKTCHSETFGGVLAVEASLLYRPLIEK